MIAIHVSNVIDKPEFISCPSYTSYCYNCCYILISIKLYIYIKPTSLLHKFTTWSWSLTMKVGQKLLYEDYMYTKKASYKTTIWWECSQSSDGLAVKHPAPRAKGHRFDPSKRSKLFQRLISRFTKSWVADHVKWYCRLQWIIKNKGGR